MIAKRQHRDIQRENNGQNIRTNAEGIYRKKEREIIKN